MSTITKEDTIRATLGKYINLDIVSEYCVEMGKDSEDVNQLISILSVYPMLASYCYDIALEYFQRKYEIVLYYSKNGNLINAY